MDEDSIFKNRVLFDDKALKRLAKSYFSLQLNDPTSIQDYLLEIDNVELSLERFYKIQLSLREELIQLQNLANELEEQKLMAQEGMNKERYMIEQEKRRIELKKELDSIVNDIQRLPGLSTLNGHCKALEKDIQEIQSSLNQRNKEQQSILQNHVDPQLNQMKLFHDTFLLQNETMSTQSLLR